uniref:Glutaredoxin n=1 Tax=Sarcopeltis skottsbergii TaxID=2765380 RepID=A0A7M3VH88_SARSK|nr:glutaredoxin-like protein [Sarcopeltis skottsbergii]
MNNNIYSYINELIREHKIIVFMKGEKLMPMCGFSNTVIEILNSFNIDYHIINVLKNDKIRKDIKIYSQWPTIPQVYINGEFIGGADIIMDLYQKLQLQEILERSMNS